MQMPPTCMWLVELSLVRNETSRAESRSMCPCAIPPNLPPMRRAAAIFVTTLVLAGCGSDDRPSTDPAGNFDADRAFQDLSAQVEIGPRPAGTPAARETAEFIAGRLREAGLDNVSIQSPWENVLGTIPGDLPGTVVVGAHYDTKSGIPRFLGANDGASGVAVLLEL